MLGVVGVAVLLIGAVALLGGVMAARSTAQTGADLAALAAADALNNARGTRSPCELAAQVAAQSGATVTACTVEGNVVAVTAAAPSPVGTASAQARAGPVSGSGR